MKAIDSAKISVAVVFGLFLKAIASVNAKTAIAAKTAKPRCCVKKEVKAQNTPANT